MSKRPVNWQARAGAYTALVWVLPAAMGACWWIGNYFDKRSGADYWSLVGLGIGFVAGLYETIRQADRIEKGP